MQKAAEKKFQKSFSLSFSLSSPFDLIALLALRLCGKFPAPAPKPE